MATPNLVNITSITPFTIAGQVTTSATDVIDVAAEKCHKINSLIISNGIHKNEIKERGNEKTAKSYEAICNYIQSDLKW